MQHGKPRSSRHLTSATTNLATNFTNQIKSNTSFKILLNYLEFQSQLLFLGSVILPRLTTIFTNMHSFGLMS